MNEQQNFWANEYAEIYMSRNKDFDLSLGVEAWKIMTASICGEVDSILECGCNIGRNIACLNSLMPGAEKSIIEIAKPAFDFVTKSFKLNQAFNGSIVESDLSGNFNLVFTSGVLIHVHPDDLLSNMTKIFTYADKYILIAEYFNRTPTMLTYHGQENKLFKRDFGRLFINNFPVRLVDYGFLWGYVYDKAGFDDITWWLFRK